MYIECPQCRNGSKDCTLLGTTSEYEDVEYDPDSSDCDCELTDEEIEILFNEAIIAARNYCP